MNHSKTSNKQNNHGIVWTQRHYTLNSIHWFELHVIVFLVLKVPHINWFRNDFSLFDTKFWHRYSASFSEWNGNITETIQMMSVTITHDPTSWTLLIDLNTWTSTSWEVNTFKVVDETSIERNTAIKKNKKPDFVITQDIISSKADHKYDSQPSCTWSNVKIVSQQCNGNTKDSVTILPASVGELLDVFRP